MRTNDPLRNLQHRQVKSAAIWEGGLRSAVQIAALWLSVWTVRANAQRTAMASNAIATARMSGPRIVSPAGVVTTRALKTHSGNPGG
jgi:hypothetical protein